MVVQREIQGTFDKLSKAVSIVAIVGARQAGKTTFLKEQIAGKKASYVLFDDPDARTLFEADIKKFEKQFIEGYDVSVLDEVQYCQDAGRKLKYLADTGRIIWMTASSEILLGKEILSFLVGRVAIMRLYPFSFSEFLTAKKQQELTSESFDRNLWEHALYGGYPKIVLTEDFETKKLLLKDIYETMILKDIAKTFSIADIRSLEEFTKYFAFSIGNILSYETCANQLNLSFQTVKKYVDAMEKSYLVQRIPPFYRNKTKEISKQPKIYFIDTGLRNFIARTFSQEPDGKLFENYVLSELVKKGFSPKYWRTKTKAEVDFVIETDNSVTPIEVKLHADAGTVERSMRSFIDTYHPKEAFVISYKKSKGEIKIGNCTVYFRDFSNLELLKKL